MMKRIPVFLLLALFVCFLAQPAAAAPPERAGAEASADFDGYIVKLSNNKPIEAMALPDDATTDIRGSDAANGAYLVVDTLDEAALIPPEYVEYIEPNYIVTLDGQPDDPLYGEYQWNLRSIGMESAYDLGLNGSGVKIAFIDSGIYSGHEDLDPTLITGKNFADDGNPYTDDLTGHGTFAAGIVAAQTDNGKGIAGIAPEAEIMAYRAFSGKNTTVAAVVDAINAAVADGCDILNMSLGATSSSQLLQEAVDSAEAAGVVMVAAVGNAGTAVLNYPAAYTGVIGVGSVDSGLNHSAFSNSNSSVFVTAPGEDVYSLGILADDQYVSGSGTSYGAPVVSGLAALALGYDSDITPDGIRYLLENTSTDKGAVGYDNQYGYGVVNAAAFVGELTRSFNINYVLSGGELPAGAKNSYSVTDADFSLPIPSRDGYAFAGWYEASDLSGAKTTAIRAGSLGDRTFFASWTPASNVALASVMVDGVQAVWQGGDDGHYLAVMPFGADLSLLTIGNISAVPAAQGSVANATKSAGDSSGASWTITVWAGLTSKEYSLLVEVMPLHVGADKGAQEGDASPASLDGLTGAAPYAADTRPWFTWGDGSGPLPADFTCAAELETGKGSVSVDSDGYTARYVPSPEEAGSDARILIYGVSGGLRTPDTVTLTVHVGALPFSQPVAGDTATYDLYTQTNAELTLTLFDNRITAVSIDGAALQAGSYSLSEITADGKNLLILSRESVAGLSPGDHAVLISFGAGTPCGVTLTVADSAPRYTVTFTNLGQTWYTANNIRAGGNVILPADPAQAGYTFAGWYTAAGVKFTSATIVTQNLALAAAWIPDSGAGGGGGGGMLREPVPDESDAEPAGSDTESEKETSFDMPFSDVGVNDWFYGDVQFAVKSGLFNGTDENAFSPNAPISRAMAVTVLYRLYLQSATNETFSPGGFIDVPDNAYYSSAVAWAAEAGIVSGYDSEHFGPGDTITRQDFAVILMRYIQLTKPDIVVTQDYISFADEDEIAGYAKDSVQTLYKLGIINGTGENRIDPEGSATRAQAAAMLHRFIIMFQQL